MTYKNKEAADTDKAETFDVVINVDDIAKIIVQGNIIDKKTLIHKKSHIQQQQLLEDFSR